MLVLRAGQKIAFGVLLLATGIKMLGVFDWLGWPI